MSEKQLYIVDIALSNVYFPYTKEKEEPIAIAELQMFSRGDSRILRSVSRSLSAIKRWNFQQNKYLVFKANNLYIYVKLSLG